MPPGSKVLYLGAASGTTVSHVSDIVGPVSFYRMLAVRSKRTINFSYLPYFRRDLFMQLNSLIALVAT